MSLSEKLSCYLKCRKSIDPRAVHGLSFKLGCLRSASFCNSLLQAYSSLSMSADARKLFDEILQPNVTTWSAMISCYTRIGDLVRAVSLIKESLLGTIGGYGSEGIFFPHVSHLGSVIAGCARARDLKVGLQMHCAAIKVGVEHDTFIVSTLIDMYGKCGKNNESLRIFNQTPNGDAVTWTSIITCLANSGESKLREAALEVFKDMIGNGIWPVSMTFASLVKIFDEPKKCYQAKQAHGCMVKLGINIDDVLGSALITMYGRCGSLDEAIRLSARVNMDVVSWTSLLVAYTKNGYNVHAISVFSKIIENEVAVDSFMIASAIGACSSMAELRTGEEIYCYALRHGFLSDVSVCNALITFYGRCSQTKKAKRVFQMMRNKDIISWTALLTCYGQNGCGEEAIHLFQEMLHNGISLPMYCISGAIRACSVIASLSIGERIHCWTVKTGTDNDLSVGNSLITMYAKCGHVELALRVFGYMTNRDIVSWNAMITGFSQHGHEREALELFKQMQKEGIQPDDYTFIGVLVSCSGLGLVSQGCQYFRVISEEYGLEPKLEHYACLVHLFGRAGKLYDALEFINTMPYEPDQLIWEALLASCKNHGDVELVKYAAKKIMQMRPEDPSPYIALSTMYASMSMWDRKAFVQAMMRDAGLQKDPGISWIEAQDSSDDTIYALQLEGT
ncbi:hypothetical protein Cni_G24132 [Canna indica]|uniref:Pentatricopeptide repeat-containing protein n=1 Tax=Canna indica TaxID=4628 RepID=A0AAQ3QJT5_9LILI|nr:hypothetical protein Cni_G24132 [Canna indica]